VSLRFPSPAESSAQPRENKPVGPMPLTDGDDFPKTRPEWSAPEAGHREGVVAGATAVRACATTGWRLTGEGR
jgi:hypothetical protein